MKFRLIAILFTGLLLASCNSENNIQSGNFDVSKAATSLVENLTNKISN